MAPLASDTPPRDSRWQRHPEPWQRMLGLYQRRLPDYEGLAALA